MPIPPSTIRSLGATFLPRPSAELGITAGASAPEVLVQGVVGRLKEWGGRHIEEATGKRERVVLSLPKGLG